MKNTNDEIEVKACAAPVCSAVFRRPWQADRYPNTPRIPTRPRCHRCQRYITIDTHADDDLWEEVIGERFGPGYICADCFTRAADERLIKWEGRLRLVPISLATQMEIQAQVTSQNVPAELPPPSAPNTAPDSIGG